MMIWWYDDDDDDDVCFSGVVIYDQGLRGEQEMQLVKERHARGEITSREANQIAEKMYSEIVLTNKRMVKWYVGKTDDLLILALSPGNFLVCLFV